MVSSTSALPPSRRTARSSMLVATMPHAAYAASMYGGNYGFDGYCEYVSLFAVFLLQSLFPWNTRLVQLLGGTWVFHQ